LTCYSSKTFHNNSNFYFSYHINIYTEKADHKIYHTLSLSFRDYIYDTICKVSLSLMLLQTLLLTIQSTTDLLLLLVIAIVSILIILALVSIPVWISAKILTMGRAKFGRAMLVTAVGPIVYFVILSVSTLLLSSLPIGSNNSFSLNWLALAVAFIAWIYVIKKGFKTGWIRALGISILAIIVFVTIGIVVAYIVQLFVPDLPLSLPSTPPSTIVPIPPLGSV
jgi:hypothetical protein